MKKKLDLESIKKEARGILKKTRSRLKVLGRETKVLARRGEKGLAKITRVGTEEVGILSLNVRKNRLYHEIGKKVYQMHTAKRFNTRGLKKLCAKIDEIEKSVEIKKKKVSGYMKK